MGKVGDRHEAEGARTSLDGVGGTEDTVDKIHISGAGLQFHQPTFHDIEAFETFLEKNLMELGHVYRHMMFSALLFALPVAYL